MLNYVAAYVLTYLIFNSESYWRETRGLQRDRLSHRQGAAGLRGLAEPIHVQGARRCRSAPGSRSLAAVVLWFLYSRTRFGFEAQVLGDSPRAARYAGMRTRRKILAVMAISGAIAGLGGASQDGDFRHTLDADPNGLQRQYYGYTGIVVAALARYNPFAVLLVAFLVGGLQNAGNTLQGADFPSGLVGVMQGMILFSALGGELLVRYRPLRPGASRLRSRRVNNSLLVVLIASGIAYGTPLLYAALGELLAERSGVLNLGVEGMMLVGAVMGFWTVQRLHVTARSRSPRRSSWPGSRAPRWL